MKSVINRSLFITLFISIAVSNPFAQENNKSEKDSLGETKNVYNIFNPLNFRGLQLHIPESVYLQHEISDYRYYNIITPYDELNQQLDTYHKGMKLLLSLAYNDMMKYDLGKVGQYLEISQKIIAIILAAISALKKYH